MEFPDHKIRQEWVLLLRAYAGTPRADQLEKPTPTVKKNTQLLTGAKPMTYA